MRANDTNETSISFGPHIDAAIARLDAAPAPVPPAPHDARTERSVTREGLLAGTFAAAGVAVGFAFIDVRVGIPYFTPTLLGSALGRVLGVSTLADSTYGAVAGYTVLHFVGFITLATAIAATLRRAQRDVRALGAGLLLFAVVELAFAGFVALLAAMSATAAVAWPQLALGNVLGWLLLAGWMWRAHPEVADEFAQMVDGAESRRVS